MQRKKPCIKPAYILTSSFFEQSRNLQIYNDSQKGCKKLAVGFQVLKDLSLSFAQSQ